jgi:hypothetical protein
VHEHLCEVAAMRLILRQVERHLRRTGNAERILGDQQDTRSVVDIGGEAGVI